MHLASFGESAIKPGTIKAGEIEDEKGLAEAIKEGLKNIKGEKLGTKYIIASLPEEKAFIRVIEMPVMAEADLKRAAYFEAENHIPLSLEKVYLDSQSISRSRGRSDRLDVLIVALPKEIINSYLSVFHKAGLKPVAFEVEAQAISRALIKKGSRPRSVLLIDLGSTRTGLSFFSESSLRFTATIPPLSDSLSKDELIREIKKHLEYYQNYERTLVTETLLCGGRANLKGLPDLFSRELGIRASIGNPWTNILPEPLKEIPELSFEDSLKYTTALGLALYDKLTTTTI